MTTSTAREVLLADPLSEVTRRERRALLGAATFAILVAKTGLVPTKIDALGIELSAVDQSSFLIVLSLVVAYFFVAFVVYGTTELLSWRHAYQEHLIEWAHELDHVQNIGGPEEDPAYNYIKPAWWLYRLSKPAAFFRLFFEFAVPVLVGSYAIVSIVDVAL